MNPFSKYVEATKCKNVGTCFITQKKGTVVSLERRTVTKLLNVAGESSTTSRLTLGASLNRIEYLELQCLNVFMQTQHKKEINETETL